MNRNPLLKFICSTFRKGLVCVAVSIAVMAGFGAVNAESGIPRLGEASLFNLQQERQLGKNFHDELKRRGFLIEDPFVTRFINELGGTLLSALPDRLREYTFFVVKDDSINAFALPGGYIGLNAGLIAQSTTVHQLASVMAHEIAHVRLMHGIQLMERASELNQTAMISILAAILLGGVSGEAGTALLYGGIASSEQLMVNYTREFEYEADRLGIGLLQDAGYDAKGMSEFFEVLRARSFGTSIEYLRTHPINDNRIAEIQNRVDNSVKIVHENEQFINFRSYLFFLANQKFLPPTNNLSVGLHAILNNRLSVAESVLDTLYQDKQEDIWVGHVFATNLIKLSKAGEAVKIYRALLDIYPEDFAISLALLETLQLAGNLTEAEEFGRELRNRFTESAEIFSRLTSIYQDLGNSLEMQLAEAEYHRLTGNFHRAGELYDEILKDQAVDDATRLSVKERQIQISSRTSNK